MTTFNEMENPPNLQRLQRVLAAAGIGSRRECELVILEGRVEVDGQLVTALGTKVNPDQQKVFVDGQRIAQQRLEYYMLNKPTGVLSTSNDPSGRARVIDLIKTDQRVYNVGRLDQFSEGLILVTNDGDLANKLTHPKYGFDKKYQVKVDGVPTAQQLRSLEEGVYIAEGKAQAKSAKLLRKTESHSWLEIVLSEGKNREIRRILAKLGHKVRVLKRVAIGPLKLADLPVGAHRRLTFQEIKMLKRAADGLAVVKPVKNQKGKFGKKSASKIGGTKIGGTKKEFVKRKPSASRSQAVGKKQKYSGKELDSQKKSRGPQKPFRIDTKQDGGTRLKGARKRPGGPKQFGQLLKSNRTNESQNDTKSASKFKSKRSSRPQTANRNFGTKRPSRQSD